MKKMRCYEIRTKGKTDRWSCVSAIGLRSSRMISGTIQNRNQLSDQRALVLLA